MSTCAICHKPIPKFTKPVMAHLSQTFKIHRPGKPVKIKCVRNAVKSNLCEDCGHGGRYERLAAAVIMQALADYFDPKGETPSDVRHMQLSASGFIFGKGIEFYCRLLAVEADTIRDAVKGGRLHGANVREWFAHD